MSSQSDGFEFRLGPLQRLLALLYRVINTVVVWDRLPRISAALNLIVFRNRLRERNLHHTGYGLAPPDGSSAADHARWRSADGSFNSLTHPRMGMAGTRFGRNVPLPDAVPDNGDALLDPSPRVISRELLARRDFIPATTLNLLAAAWIQFETHNWFSHGQPEPGDEFKIPLPPGDDWPDASGCMHVRRTLADPTSRESWLGATPTFRNFNSHWWDAGQIYGSSREQQMQIRSGRDGMIALGPDGMLPEDPAHPGFDFTGFNDNWWIGLSLLHNLFAREHNTICHELKQRYPAWNDEELFQHARLINGALIAKIHTVEWTPAILAHPALVLGMHTNWYGLPWRVMRMVLGKDNETANGVPGTPAHQHSAPYAMTEEFASVYRLHPLLPEDVGIRSLDDHPAVTYEFVKVQGKHTRALMQEHGFVDVLYSLGIANPGAIRLHNYPNFLRKFEKDGQPLMDVAAIDILRDRERGVPRYNRFRELVGKKRVKTFEEITSIPGAAAKMREIYKNDVDRVDLMVGLLAEDLPKGFGFSDTAFRVFILMASRRLKSDRFFTDDFRPEIYTEFGMEWIQSNSMTSVLLRHVPELEPALKGVKNGFAPWNRVA